MECALGQMVIALLLLLAVPANAQESIFRDAGGNFVRSARVDPQGTTIFRDRSGNVTGTARRDPEGTTVFRDHSGNIKGTARTR
jgi:hypothetical protein